MVADLGFGPYGGQIGAPKQSSGMIEVQRRRAAKEKKLKESNLKDGKGRSSKEYSGQKDDKNNNTM